MERDDFSSGTSSRSTKLIHGGVRYLQKAIMGLDFEQVHRAVFFKGAGTPVLANLHRFCKLHKIHALHKNQGLFQPLT